MELLGLEKRAEIGLWFHVKKENCRREPGSVSQMQRMSSKIEIEKRTLNLSLSMSLKK